MQKRKYTAEMAEREMALLGTREGERIHPGVAYWKATSDGSPKFRLHELLEHWDIKPYFSQQKAAFEKAMKSAIAAAKNPDDDASDDGAHSDGAD